MTATTMLILMICASVMVSTLLSVYFKFNMQSYIMHMLFNISVAIVVWVFII